ncbi:uncharacterized serine-rich protein C215.13 [Tetranychus urticae]|uniref:Uncharacterized protein n=1 Tax=Tetranychus urticae TaxID=32264 RepID=T1KXJ0_TETUR|nr:uncharacterized serine-rich protein C215.13 [Tetranychus urticae]
MDHDRKPPRFILNCGKRPTDNNDSLTTPIIDPNAPLSTTGPHFPSFDHQTDNAFGQYLQELSQSVSSDVYENNKQEKPTNASTTFPPFPSLTTSSIPTPAIKYNHRHQQSQQSQSQSQPQPQIQIQAPAQSATQSQQHQPPCASQVPSPSQQHSNNHSLTNGQNNHSQPTSNSASSPPNDAKPSVPSFHVSSSSAHDYASYISPKHGGIDYISINSSHPVPIPVTVITTGCLSSASSTSTITPQSRIVEHNQQFISSTPQSVSKLSINNTSSTSTVATSDEVPCSSSRSNHLSVSRRLAPFSPVSTVSTSSQASTVGKESMQYILPSGSDDERSSRATPGRKKKMDPSRRSKLTKKEKLDKIISEEKRLQASNTALKQRMKVMENDCNLLQNIITNILIDAAKRKQSESLQSSQENQGNLKESST